MPLSPLERLAVKRQGTQSILSSAQKSIRRAVKDWDVHPAIAEDINLRIRDLSNIVDTNWESERLKVINEDKE